MTLQELINTTRIVLNDNGDISVRWTDEELTILANQSYFDAVIRISGNLTSTQVETQISVLIDQSEYPVDKSITQIVRAKMLLQDVPLVEETFRNLDEFRTGWQATKDTPTHYIEDMDRHVIQLYPIPIVNDTLELTVYKLPSAELTINDSLDYLPEHLHYGVVFLICSLAYQKINKDTFNPERADYYENLSIKYFGQRKSANAQEFERDFKQKKVRTAFFA